MKDKASEQEDPSMSQTPSELLSDSPRDKTQNSEANADQANELSEIQQIEQRMEQIMKESMDAISMND